jgi:hypothetical protein
VRLLVFERESASLTATELQHLWKSGKIRLEAFFLSCDRVDVILKLRHRGIAGLLALYIFRYYLVP